MILKLINQVNYDYTFIYICLNHAVKTLDSTLFCQIKILNILQKVALHKLMYFLFYLQMPIIRYCLFTNAFYRPTGVYQFCSSLKVGTTSLNWSNS